MTESRFPANLKKLRKLRGLSQEELARQTGLKRGNIASYEGGTAEPKIEYLIRFAELFSVSMDELVRGTEASLENAVKVPSAAVLMQRNQILLKTFVEQSEEIRTMLEGFRKFYALRMGKINEASRTPELKSLASDFENLMEVMGHSLDNNEKFIQELSELS